jgi:uncharacterized protein DUF547
VPPWARADQAFLQRWVTVVSSSGTPLATRVDYEGIAARRDRDRMLAEVRTALLSVDPATLDDRARLAWAIDTYNFLVIERIVQHLHRGPGGRVGSVHDIPGFFDEPAVTVRGRTLALDQFEGVFVFPDRNLSAPLNNHWRLDPRAHFALVCGAVGCPPLRREVYVPEALDAQLDQATNEALASPAHLRFNPATGGLEQSQIFAWYPWDFDMRGWDFLVQHAPEPMRAEIARRKFTQASGVIPWDWNLNQAPRR